MVTQGPCESKSPGVVESADDDRGAFAQLAKRRRTLTAQAVLLSVRLQDAGNLYDGIEIVKYHRGKVVLEHGLFAGIVRITKLDGRVLILIGNTKQNRIAGTEDGHPEEIEASLPRRVQKPTRDGPGGCKQQTHHDQCNRTQTRARARNRPLSGLNLAGCLLVAGLGPAELRNVRTRGKRQTQLALMFGNSIVLGNALADFGGRHAHDRVRGGVVIVPPAKNLDADGALF